MWEKKSRCIGHLGMLVDLIEICRIYCIKFVVVPLACITHSMLI